MPDALGQVVQREADHQERGQRGLAGGEGGADGEPLAEIVQPDAERDEGREREALGGAAAAAADHHQREEGGQRAEPDQDARLQARGGAGRDLEPLLEGIDQQERQEPQGQREDELEPAARAGAHQRIEHHAEPDRHDADEQPDHAVDQEIARREGRGRQRDLDRVIERDRRSR